MKKFPEWRGECSIAPLNARLRKGGRRFTYLNPEQTRKLLKGAETKLIDRKSHHMGEWKSWQVFIRGRWYNLCRTDLKDDIRTYGGVEIGPKYTGIAKVPIDSGHYGARLTRSAIYLIDRFSDG